MASSSGLPQLSGRRIAYLGDTSLPGPASYLAGIMTRAALPFVYVPSDRSPPDEVFADDIGLYVFSDYPSARLDAGHWQRLTAGLDAGAGLLMLGGWESFHGLGGDWDSSPLAAYLPVEMLAQDDRRNWPCAILLRVAAAHPALAGLSFAQPPSIGGYNEFRPRPGSTVVLEGERILATAAGAGFAFSSHGRFPLLVTQEGRPASGGRGRRACLATDVAPHWVGSFVDWGDQRITVAMGSDSIEVGSGYLRFFTNLIAWCLGETTSGDPS
jgi:hypothetical protein